MTVTSGSIYFGAPSVLASASFISSPYSTSVYVSIAAQGNGDNAAFGGSNPQCGVCAKAVDRFKVSDAGSMNVLVVAYCHTEEEARVMPRDNLGIVAVPKGYVAFAEKARALMVEAIPVARPTVRLISLEEEHDRKIETGE